MIGKKLRKIMEQLLLMFYMLKKKKIYPDYVSKHNSSHEKQVTLLMISNEEGRIATSKGRVAKSKERRWHYLAVKKLSVLSRGITSKHQGDFYCLNCFHSFASKNKLE